MDREEARELLLGYSRFINEETDLWEVLDLAIEALVLQDKYVKALERMIDGTKEINKFLEEATAPKEMTLEEWQELDREIQGDVESATTTDCNDCIWNTCNYNKIDWEISEDCISRADTIKAMCAECVYKGVRGDCGGDCTEVAIVKGMPPVNQKQVTSKLESAEIATSEGEESTMGQPKNKFDCISRQEVLGYIDRLTNSGLGKVKSLEYIQKYVERMESSVAPKPVGDCISWQQADTLIIAAALRDFAQDSERNISDRERAEELREQVLECGELMCKPVTPTERTGEWLEVESWNSERHAVTDMKCSECHKYASRVLPLNTTRTYQYCPNCGAKNGMTMSVKGLNSDDLFNGNEIKLEPYKGGAE